MLESRSFHDGVMLLNNDISFQLVHRLAFRVLYKFTSNHRLTDDYDAAVGLEMEQCAVCCVHAAVESVADKRLAVPSQPKMQKRCPPAMTTKTTKRC